jgi:hypothetical protein
MIRLSDVDLSAHTLEGLARLQKKVTDAATYSEQVALAKKLFSQQNKPKNKIFDEVKRSLTAMCSGAQRCCYCEDSGADEVEHIRPKDLYPEIVFAWTNYLYACGPCNGPKNNRFAIFGVDGQEHTVTRLPKAPVLPPQVGEPLLIDPRREDPLDHIELDLVDTFWFLASGDAGSRSYLRAEYTIKLLGLNKRDYLPKARREAYDSYRARLVEYIHRRDVGEPQRRLELVISALRRMGHPTVWREMQRQAQLIPELRGLFEQAPEAMTW